MLLELGESIKGKVLTSQIGPQSTLKEEKPLDFSEGLFFPTQIGYCFKARY